MTDLPLETYAAASAHNEEFNNAEAMREPEMAFYRLPFLERFDAAAKAGFTAVEYASPYEFSAKDLRSCLNACGSETGPFQHPGGRSGRRGRVGPRLCARATREFREGFRRALEYAAALDCALVHVMAGIQPADTNYDTAAAIYVANLAWAAEAAAGSGVKLVLEAINQRDVLGFFLRTQEQGASVIEAIGRDRIGLQFDIYHCQVAQGDITRRMEKLMPVIAHMQLADAPGRNEPGTGEIAWDYLFRRIDELDYRGWVGCEYRPLGETAPGLEWRKRYAL